jgi:hypothetical protein
MKYPQYSNPAVKIKYFNTMSIKVKSLEHHNFYIRYRLHIENMKSAPESLQEYLSGILDYIPKDLFTHPENPGCSGMRQLTEIQMQELSDHPIISFAQKSREHVKFKSRHENLQQWFLLNDPQAIVAELPVWMDEKESHEHLNLNFPLTGHIDLLRYHDSKVEIWDYKPSAKKEKWAKTQVYFYALLLSLRAHIPLEAIQCGYFDESTAFVFRPDG